MKKIALATLAAVLAASFASTADAEGYGKKKKRAHAPAYAAYPYATERQRQNTLAYENGGYYERLQSEHVFGSRAWWELQNRGGGRR